MNKNYPIYQTTFIDDMRSLVEEAAQNFPTSIAISYKDKPSDKEVKKVTFAQWRDDVRHLGTALIANGLREENIAIVGEIFPDADFLADKGITDAQKYFEDQVKVINAKMPPYKAVKRVKLRDVEFQKNTSRKITRFSIDKTID
jgi:hypothetical protein